MKIDYRKRFLNELSKIPSGTRSKMENFVFKELPKANSIFEVGIVEQMKGYRSYYKVRFGSYRIGLKMENDTVILERALHRKDIYRYFP
jgi:mRNA interferase RelE/StbE